MKKFGNLFLFLMIAGAVCAQVISTPPSGGNQKASVTQYLGITWVTVTYNSPDVHGPDGSDRTGHIWGDLVPYGMRNEAFGLSTDENPSPWRAGANENTTITFSHDMKIGGKPVSAGTYGLHMIAGPEEWTIILSNNSTAWGSFYYRPSEDALRFVTKPVSSSFNEWLTYEFTDRQLNSCTLELRWENLSVPMPIEIPDIDDVYYRQIKSELEGTPVGFTYQGWVDGANYLAANKYNLDEALVWANNAIEGQFYSDKNFTTLSCKSNVLNAMGRTKAADSLMQMAIAHPTATALDVHFYGRRLQAQKKFREALEVFLLNNKNHPDDIVTVLGLARGYSSTGDYKNSLKYAKAALGMNPDPSIRKTLEDGIKKLEEGKDFN